MLTTEYDSATESVYHLVLGLICELLGHDDTGTCFRGLLKEAFQGTLAYVFYAAGVFMGIQR
jgi:hypothetical protein